MNPNSGLNLIGHGPIDYLVVIGMVALAFWYGLSSPQKILWILPATCTFYFFVKAVTMLTPIKLVPFFYLLGLAIRGEKGFLVIKGRYWHIWILITLCFSTLLGAIYLPQFQLYIPSPHVKTRLIIQFISYFNLILIYLICYRETRKEGGVQILFKSYIYTTTFLCIYGIYQWVASQTGLPMRGIVYSSQVVGAALDFENFIFRINSFANEPKRLSYMLMISVVIMLNLRTHYKLFFRKKAIFWFVFLLHLICTFLTYSTSIYLSIGVFMGLMLILSIRRTFHRYYYKIAYAGILTVVIFLISFPTLRERLLLLYEIRVESQLAHIEGGQYVRTETDAINYLTLHPKHIPLGVGPGNYNFAFSEEFGAWKGVAGVFLFPLNSAIITLIMDFGLLGFIIFAKHLWEQLIKRPRYQSEIVRKTVFEMILFFFCISIALNPLPIYFLFVAAFDADEIRFAPKLQSIA
ncbi:MAG: hypothetical protein AAF927_01950 [Bacteroidota bacterium]